MAASRLPFFLDLAAGRARLDLFGVLVLATALLTFVGSQWVVSLTGPLLFADALGLGLFALSGAEVAVEQGRAPPLGVLRRNCSNRRGQALGPGVELAAADIPFRLGSAAL